MMIIPKEKKLCKYCRRRLGIKSYDKNHGDQCKNKPKIDRYLSIEGINNYKNMHDTVMNAMRGYYNSHIKFLNKPNLRMHCQVIGEVIGLRKSISEMQKHNRTVKAELKKSLKMQREAKRELKLRNQNGNNSSNDATSI